MIWDATLDWSFTPEEDYGGKDLIFYLEKTEPRGYEVHPNEKQRTLREVDRVPAPAAGEQVSVTVDAVGLELEPNTRYERAVKLEDNGTERTLEQGILFVLAPSVKSNPR